MYDQPFGRPKHGLNNIKVDGRALTALVRLSIGTVRGLL
jgi:hypothetical protein